MLSLRPNDFHRDGRLDYDVIWRGPEGAFVVGRIFKAHAGVPQETPWVWTVDFFQRESRTEPHQGWAESREAATAAFKRCWESSGTAPQMARKAT
jgi:hypothetical protein